MPVLYPWRDQLEQTCPIECPEFRHRAQKTPFQNGLLKWRVQKHAAAAGKEVFLVNGIPVLASPQDRHPGIVAGDLPGCADSSLDTPDSDQEGGLAPGPHHRLKRAPARIGTYLDAGCRLKTGVQNPPQIPVDPVVVANNRKGKHFPESS